ncbi:MAG: hypothetical protein ACK443_05755 [Methylococcaceae bacterium]|jgi:hypothetical protein
MIISELRELLDDYDEDETVAFFLITHQDLHQEAEALNLQLDCTTIDLAVDELQLLLSRRSVLNPTAELIALQRGVARAKSEAGESPADTSRYITIH